MKKTYVLWSLALATLMANVFFACKSDDTIEDFSDNLLVLRQNILHLIFAAFPLDNAHVEAVTAFYKVGAREPRQFCPPDSNHTL